MSVFLRWKNKSQDDSNKIAATYENKIKQFDERVSTLKDENLELRKRIDQLEELCTRHVIDRRCELLELHISKLEDENLRLFDENRYQRKQYEMFLGNVTQMVLRTLFMQQSIRKECNEIYQIIDDLSKRSLLNQLSWCRKKGNKKSLRSVSCETINSNNINSSSQIKNKKSSFAPCELTQSCVDCHLRKKTPPTTTSDFIKQFCNNKKEKGADDTYSTSSTTLCSFSTTGSWTLDLSFYDKETTYSTPLSNTQHSTHQIRKESTECKEQNKGEKHSNESNNLLLSSTDNQQLLQRSETFVIGKVPPVVEVITAGPMTVNKQDDHNSKIQRCSTTRSLAASSTTRTSRLPYRRATIVNTRNIESSPLTKSQPSQTRSLSSSQKSSKLPVLQPKPKQTLTTQTKLATTKGLSKKVVPINRITTVKKQPVVPIHTNYLKRTSISPRIKSKENTTVHSRSSTTGGSNPKRTKISTPLSSQPVVMKTDKAVSWIIETTDIADESKQKQDIQMNTTSSESSIEEKQRIGDEGYSTMSSDIRDVSFDSLKRSMTTKNSNDSNRDVNNWLDTNTTTKKPVKQPQIMTTKKTISTCEGPFIPVDELEQFKKQLENDSNVICPFVRTNRRNPSHKTTNTNEHVVPTTLVKELSADSLDEACCCSTSSDGPPQTLSSGTTTNSTTDEKDQALPRSETFDKILVASSVQMECNTDNNDDSTDSTCSDINQLFMDYEKREAEFSLGTRYLHHLIKPEKRLVFPGIIGRLLFLRRVLSDSDIYRKVCLKEEELRTNVYHMDTIREHSIELNLLSTYGSETELRAWSQDCWETRFAEYRAMFDDEEENEQRRLTPIPMRKYNQNDAGTSQMMCLDDDELSSLSFTDDEHHHHYDQQIALERQQLLQQIYEYPWSYDDLDNIDYSLPHPSSLEKDEPPPLLLTPDSTKQQQDNLLLLTHDFKSDFYQLCTLTASSSFAYTNTRSNTPNSRQTTPPISNSSTSSSAASA